MQTYIVQPGDTLYGISKQFGITVEDIKLANNMVNNDIHIGEALLIPTIGTTTLYVVKPGDSLYSIANKYNTTVAQLISLNNLKTNVLSIGQQLKIPINDNSGDFSFYIVKVGDSLYSIAKKFNTTVDSLIKINNLSTNLLSIGQQLKVPNENIQGEEEYLIYIVRPNDTLYSIAKKYNMSVDSLISLNKLTSNNLSIGQQLKVNPTLTDNILMGSTCIGEGYSEPSYITYTVKSGDSLYIIAKKYNTSVDNIIKLNNLTTNNLTIGQKLKIKEVN